MYQLYVQTKQGSWEKSYSEQNDLQKLQEKIKQLNKKDFFGYLIIERSSNGDQVIEGGKFFEETGEIEVKKPEKLKKQNKKSKMKEKEELRKLTEKYRER